MNVCYMPKAGLGRPLPTHVPLAQERGSAPESPRHWQNLSIGPRLRASVSQEPFCTDGHLCLTSELGFFLPMARGFRKRPRLMKARDSDYCCLRLFAFPGELFRLPLVWDPSAVPSGLLAGLTSTCL